MNLLSSKCMLMVSDGSENLELGLAEFVPNNNVFSEVGVSHEIRLDLRISASELQRLEEIRKGGDLLFLCHSFMWMPASYTRDDERTTENVHVNVIQDGYFYYYPRSDWIADLNETDFAKIDLIEIPQLQLLDIAASRDIQRFLKEAQKAIREARYGDALGECRKVLNVVYNAVDNWGTAHDFEKEMGPKLQNMKGRDRVNALRRYTFEKLVGHAEKGDRLNNLRNALFQYLSLDVHEADNEGMEFTPHDASFAMRITAGFAANVLRYLASYDNKH